MPSLLAPFDTLLSLGKTFASYAYTPAKKPQPKMPSLDFASRIPSCVEDLFAHLAQGCESKDGLGSMSACAYDTAWVSMVQRLQDGKLEYVFPLCFENLLVSQTADGGWGVTGSQIDAILNTMAALLALRKRQSKSERADEVAALDVQIKLAVVFLQAKLDVWDVEGTDHVGFEILVPAHLAMLATEGIPFTFPGLAVLTAMNQKKLAKFRPEMLYSKHQTTLIHSLEAFFGQLNYDNVKHHLVAGSMMGSPSSTAAYLMSSSQWDDEAETWLRSAIAHGAGKGTGALPSAFPSTIFEVTWVCIPLLQSEPELTKEGCLHIACKRGSHKQHCTRTVECSQDLPRDSLQQPRWNTRVRYVKAPNLDPSIAC